jgi:ferredoxin
MMMTRFDIDMAKCMYCGLCSEPCPTGSIHHTPEFEGADYSLESMVRRFVKDPVVAYKPKKEGQMDEPEIAPLLERGLRYVERVRHRAERSHERILPGPVRLLSPRRRHDRVGAITVAFSRNIVYSAFALVGSFMGVAGLYVFARGRLHRVVQVLLYVGGILVLILFAVMLTHRIADVRISNRSVGPAAGAADR